MWSLDHLPTELTAGAEEMEAVEGIGPGIVRLIEEFRSRGTLDELERLDDQYPADVAAIARLPRITPGRLRDLRGLGVDTVADLLAALDTGAISTVEGVGPATVDRWAALLALPPAPGAVPAHRGAVAASRLRHHLLDHLSGDEVRVAGAVRRLDEWVGRIDLVVVTDDPARLVHFLEDSAVAASSAVEPGWAIDLVTHDRIPVAVRISDREAAGTALLRWTGPDSHVEELGLTDEIPYPTEEAAYGAVARPWIPPPARSLEAVPPELLGVDDVAGDLHCHSDWSPDGHMALEGIAEAALQRGYEYLVITDHTIGLRFGGLDAQALGEQRRLIEQVRRQFPDLRLLHGAEVNIDRDGVPDLDDETLGWLDFVVAGCHSHFDLPRPQQTARLIAAVRHPDVDVLAHPTGRRLGIRPGFDVDLSPVFDAAAEAGTALEVNGHRDRLDLSASNAAAAAAAGVMLAADSDAHRYPELDNMRVAVGAMQRAGVTRHQVVNALPLDGFLAWVDGEA